MGWGTQLVDGSNFENPQLLNPGDEDGDVRVKVERAREQLGAIQVCECLAFVFRTLNWQAIFFSLLYQNLISSNYDISGNVAKTKGENRSSGKSVQTFLSTCLVTPF